MPVAGQNVADGICNPVQIVPMPVAGQNVADGIANPVRPRIGKLKGLDGCETSPFSTSAG